VLRGVLLDDELRILANFVEFIDIGFEKLIPSIKKKKRENLKETAQYMFSLLLVCLFSREITNL